MESNFCPCFLFMNLFGSATRKYFNISEIEGQLICYVKVVNVKKLDRTTSTRKHDNIHAMPMARAERLTGYCKTISVELKQMDNFHGWRRSDGHYNFIMKRLRAYQTKGYSALFVTARD